MDLHLRARLLALACSALVIVSSLVAPLRPAVAAEASAVDAVQAPEPAPFTLYIQPSAPAFSPPQVPSQAPLASSAPATPTIAPTALQPVTAAPANRRGNAVMTPWRQPGSGSAPSAIHAAAASLQTSAVPQLTYGSGPVERAGSKNYSIFWKPAGSSMSANYQTLINRYFQDIGGSQFYGVMTQFYDTGGSIVNNATVGGTWTDTTVYPSHTPSYPANTLTDTDITDSVKRAMTANNWWPAAGGNNANFFVYTAAGEESCLDPTTCSTNYFCAYHSDFSVAHAGSTLDIKYANHPYDGNHLNGCGTLSSPNNDADADSEISSTSHEHFEMVTDPDPSSGWVDSNGDENGDKCRNSYGVPDSDISLNGHPYSLQQEWSNIEAGCAWSLPGASFTLTTDPSSAGNGAGSITVSPTGLNCAAVCSVNFPLSTAVTLTATSASGSAFSGWGGACSGSGSCNVTMSAARSVTAAFTLTPCLPRPAVTVSVTSIGAGQFQATLTSTGANNALQSIQFGSATNALIDIGSQTGRTGNFSVALGAGVPRVTFTVRRVTSGVATTVPLVVTDSCGTWSTFVGVGSSVP